MDTREIGMTVLRLGGGRRRLTDKIDHRVGLSGLCSVGQALETGETMAIIHARSDADAKRAASMLEAAIAIEPGPPPSNPLVIDRIDEGS